jgi:hypothetical protein
VEITSSSVVIPSRVGMTYRKERRRGEVSGGYAEMGM